MLYQLSYAGVFRRSSENLLCTVGGRWQADSDSVAKSAENLGGDSLRRTKFLSFPEESASNLASFYDYL